MKAAKLVFALALAVCGPVFGAEPQITDDAQSLQGTWTVQATPVDGGPACHADGEEWVFVNDRLVVVSKDGSRQSGRFTLGPAGSKMLSWLFDHDDDGEHVHRRAVIAGEGTGLLGGSTTVSASYEIEGDSLKLTFQSAGSKAGVAPVSQILRLSRTKSDRDTRDTERSGAARKPRGRC